MVSRDDFVFALLATFEALGKAEPSKAALTVWCSAMTAAGLTWEQASNALAQHVATPGSGKFAPTPADVIEKIKGTAKDQRDGLEALASVEWGRVIGAMRTFGSYRSVVFDDWRTMAAVKSIGGWVTIGLADQDTLNVMQAQFRRSYFGSKPENAPAFLGGIHGGEDGEKAVLIGDQGKCKAILASGTRGDQYRMVGAKQLQAPAKSIGQILQIAKAGQP